MNVNLDRALKLLLDGDVVAIPTETVYGLAASLSHPAAISRIFNLKGRSSNNPLIIHVADTSQVIPFAKTLPPGFELLAKNFWPGALTIVIPIDLNKVPEKARAGLPTAAFRVPAHPLTRQLLAQSGPLVMPSANLSGKPSATTSEHVEADFGAAFPVLNGGPCEKGLESTILYFDGAQWEIIRQGALPPEAFTSILGYTPQIARKKAGEQPLCPGQLYRHYAPKAQLLLTKEFAPDMQGVVVGFEGRPYPSACHIIPFGPISSPNKVAENLYKVLRKLDDEGVASAWVDMNFPDDGLWSTIAERLNKAAQT